jgi:transposase-like protein
MPKPPNPNNPPCPLCGGPTGRSGKTTAGQPAYKCVPCKKRFSLNPTGRPRLGSEVMSHAEKSKRYRAKKKLEGKG